MRGGIGAAAHGDSFVVRCSGNKGNGGCTGTREREFPRLYGTDTAAGCGGVYAAVRADVSGKRILGSGS